MASGTGATVVCAPEPGTVPGLRILAREKEVLQRRQAAVNAAYGEYSDYDNYDNIESGYDNYDNGLYHDH
ncbi:MAG: hypothetical protein Q8L46_00080 [candidate division WWE3 bacterium]|nr:hypothetical protein [candidate division WWE3 bacterium]